MANGEYYLEFRQVPDSRRKTKVLDVHSTRSGIKLGRIAWYGAWRQYVFYPEPATLFNRGCLDTITGKIRGLMQERRTHLEERQRG